MWVRREHVKKEFSFLADASAKGGRGVKDPPPPTAKKNNQNHSFQAFIVSKTYTFANVKKKIIKSLSPLTARGGGGQGFSERAR